MNIDQGVRLFLQLAREATADEDQQAEEAERANEASDLLDELNLDGEPS